MKEHLALTHTHTHTKQVRVLEVPFAGHEGWGPAPMLLGHAIDVLDFLREFAALLYNARLLLL